MPTKPVPNAKPYTGNKDGQAPAPRQGTDEFIRQCVKRCPALWPNGSWSPGRDMRGKPGVPSVHNTGRAMDLSYRHIVNVKDASNTKGVPNGRKLSKAFVETLVANANAFGIECVLDYFPKPWGRGFRCDRQKWQNYTSETIHGAPGGDWWHIELSPSMADNPEAVKAVFLAVFGPIPKPV